MKVSLVSTVKDAGPSVREFISSVLAQTRAPDEVVIVDGGSTDGTLESLREVERFTVISEPGANIARGRNVAIRTATHDVIAVTDADCVLDPTWLERIVRPIERGADVAAGFYRPLATSLQEQWAAAVAVPDEDEVEHGWMPSARSIAFRREAFDASGGYPEWLEVGEDMYLNHRMLAGGARMETALDAIVSWRVRPSLSATWRQYERYAQGDALAGLYPERHGVRFVAYGFGLVALRSKRRLPLAIAVMGGATYARLPLRRAWRRLESDPAKVASFFGVPAMMVFIDAAKMWGYAKGLAARYRGAPD